MFTSDLRNRGPKGGGNTDLEAPNTPLLSGSTRASEVPLKRKGLPHRLVVMFDGTNNLRASLTNVSRLFEAIDDSKLDEYQLINPDEYNHAPELKRCDSAVHTHKCGTCNQQVADGKPDGPNPQEEKRMKGPDGKCCECKQLAKRLQLVHYVRGVGTKIGDGVTSLAFGKGLSENIKDGYKWLVNHYEVGDEIFVFGFSRGAFSARSLVSLLHRCGGLPVPKQKQEESTTNQIVHDAYAMYQAYDPKNPSKEEYLQRRKVLDGNLASSGQTMQEVTVAMLGVWDTVGAVGLRSSWLDPLYYHFSSTHYEFHDQDLPCIVEHAYHALAIDEHRFHFKPTLWTVPRSSESVPRSSVVVSEVDEMLSTSKLESFVNLEKTALKEVKQVWFMGSHCNVGGGADLDDLVDPDDLWQYSYVWMQKHAEKLGLRFYWTYETPTTETVGEGQSTKRWISHRQPENSYKNFAHGVYQYVRAPFYRHVTASIKSGAAKLHWSVVERIKVDAVKAVKAEPGTEQMKFEPYRPESLFRGRNPTVWERCCSWFTWLICTVVHRPKPVQDDSKLNVDSDGTITVSGNWPWPWVEFDDLKSVEQLRAAQEKQQEPSGSTHPDAKPKSGKCNCKLEPVNFTDTRCMLRKLWDWWVNWRPL